MRKIDLQEYEKPIKSLLRKKRASIAIYDEIISIIEEFLPCSCCNELLPKEEFSKSNAFKNRDYRYTICKPCVKENRRKARELIEGESDGL